VWHCGAVKGDAAVNDRVEDAIESVRRMQDMVLERRLFRGYPGVARMVSGAAALFAGAALSARWMPARPEAHLAAWAGVLGLALTVNYAALGWWFIRHQEVRTRPRLLKPALDAVPALAAGAVLTLALVARESYDLLFGTWLSLYGLAQTAYRNSLPPGIHKVGLCYVAAGIYYLAFAEGSFLNPWPVGAAFFAGEWVSGVILYKRQTGDSEPTAEPETRDCDGNDEESMR